MRLRLLLLALLTVMTPSQAVELGRSKVDHPALGTTGGAALHAQMQTIFTLLSDNANSRFSQQSSIADSTTVEVDHNFGVNLVELQVLIYTGSGSNLTRVPDPLLASPAWNIQEKTGFEKTIIEITTPSSGGPHTFAVIVIHGKGAEKINDLSDVDVQTTAPQDGQALVYNNTSSTWVPGASGDSSFKCQDVADPNVNIKAGFIGLDNGQELYLASDTNFSLDTILGSDPANATTYYLYIDLDDVPQPALLANGRSVRTVSTNSHFFLSTSLPDTGAATPSNRYIPLCFIRSATTGTVWSGTGSDFGDLAKRRHPRPVVNVNPTILNVDQSVGTIGAVENARQAISAGDFPGAASLTSIWPLTDLNAATTNGRNLTGNGTGGVQFTDLTGFYSRKVARLDGVQTYANTTNSAFSLGDADQSFGVWAKAEDISGSGHILGQWDVSDNDRSIRLNLNAGNLELEMSSNGTAVTTTSFNIYRSDFEWIHFAVVYTAADDTAIVYVNGIEIGSAAVALFTPVSPNFTIGAQSDGTQKFRGSFQDAFFTQQALTAAEINIIYSRRFKGQQIKGGHILTLDSFPANLDPSKISFFNLASDSNDDSGNGRNLTNNGPTPFTDANIFGQTNSAASHDGTTGYFTSTDGFFDFDTAEFNWNFGFWLRLDEWPPAGFEQVVGLSGAVLSFRLAFQATGEIELLGAGAANIINTAFPNKEDGKWCHIALTFDTKGTTRLYVDGDEFASAASNYPTSTGGNTFSIAASNGGANKMMGSIQDFFFVRDYVLSADDIKKIVSARIEHNKDVLVTDQGITGVKGMGDNSANETQLDTVSLITDKTRDSLYFDGTDLDPGDNITFRVQNNGVNETVVPVRNFTTGKVSSDPGAQTHGLGCRPKDFFVLHTDTSGDDDKHYDLCEADETTITCSLGSLTISGSQPVEIVASCAPFAAVFDITEPINGINFGQQTLSSYREGTWTPTISGATTDFTSVTYSSQEGDYVQVGKMLCVWVNVTWSAASGGSGNLQLDLPFAITALHTDAESHSIAGSNINSISNDLFGDLVGAASDKITVSQTQDNGGIAALTVAEANSGFFPKELRYSACYKRTAN